MSTNRNYRPLTPEVYADTAFFSPEKADSTPLSPTKTELSGSMFL